MIDLMSGVSARFSSPAADGVFVFAPSADRNALATVNRGTGVSLIDADSGKALFTNPSLYPFVLHGRCLAVSANKRWLALRLSDQVVLEDTTRPSNMPAIPCSGPFAFAPVGEELAVVNRFVVGIHDLSNRDVHDLICENEVHKLHFAPDGRRLLVATEVDVVVLDATSGKPTARLKEIGWATALACSPAGNVVAVGRHGELILWNLSTGKHHTVPIPGHSGYPWTLPTAVFAGVCAFWSILRSRKNRQATGKPDSTQLMGLS